MKRSLSFDLHFDDGLYYVTSEKHLFLDGSRKIMAVYRCDGKYKEHEFWFPKLPFNMYHGMLAPCNQYFELYRFTSGDTDMTYNDFARRLLSDPEFKEKWEVYDGSKRATKLAMLWSAWNQGAIIQRGFFTHPNSFDENDRVVSRKQMRELENSNDEDYDDAISVSTAGNWAGTFSSTLPDFDEHMEKLPYDKLPIGLVLTMDDNDINKYADWKLVTEDNGCVIIECFIYERFE